MASVEVRRVTKSWGAVTAVRDIDFAADDGSLTVLLGPSGCGKSTTLRLIAGLDPVSSGSIHIGRRDVTQAEPSKRGLSMVFQSYALFPHLSVAENIVFGLRIRRVPRGERERRLNQAAQLLGLSPLLARKPAQLSGGQQQRVALGRAIVAESAICLMDEPLSNLDTQLRHEMRREIRDLQQRLGMTMIYVTHDQIEAMSMADRVILLRNGEVEQNGTPADLYTRPATLFAAGFIGTPPMNLLRVTNGPACIVLEGTKGPVLVPGFADDKVVFGIRPEDIRLDEHGPLEALVVSCEYQGADSVLTCRVGAQELHVRQPGVTRVPAGTPVRLQWHSDSVHLFAKAGGRRLQAVPPPQLEVA